MNPITSTLINTLNKISEIQLELMWAMTIGLDLTKPDDEALYNALNRGLIDVEKIINDINLLIAEVEK